MGLVCVYSVLLEDQRCVWSGSQLAQELKLARESEARLRHIAQTETQSRKRNEAEVARLQSVVHDGYSKIASVEAIAENLQTSVHTRALPRDLTSPGFRIRPCLSHSAASPPPLLRVLVLPRRR